MCIYFVFHLDREIPRETVKASINLALKLRDSFPDHFAGFDLVGEEDTGYPLFYYINELLIPSQTNRSLPYFFHAGETGEEFKLETICRANSCGSVCPQCSI